jgi:hypothetical protein
MQAPRRGKRKDYFILILQKTIFFLLFYKNNILLTFSIRRCGFIVKTNRNVVPYRNCYDGENKNIGVR